MHINYLEDGIEVYTKDGTKEFVHIDEINSRVLHKKVTIGDLGILKISLGCDEDCCEEYVAPLLELRQIRKILVGENISSTELRGFADPDFPTEISDNDITLEEDKSKVFAFLTKYPKGHSYGYSFLGTFNAKFHFDLLLDPNNTKKKEFKRLFKSK